MRNQSDDPLFRLTGLSTKDLADTLANNPRAYMALKGAVAEKHLNLLLSQLVAQKKITSYRCGKGDFEKDFYLTVPGRKKEVIVECKNVQVINTNTATSRREYLAFLVKNKYLTSEQCDDLFRKHADDIERLSASELASIFNQLPLDLRESGLPRYAFSRKLCGVDVGPPLSAKTSAEYLKLFDHFPVTIDFQRTRNSRDDGETDNKAARFYKVGELDVVAACLFSRTLEWEFIFCSAKKLERHIKYRDRYSNRVKVNPDEWKSDLLGVLE